MPIFLIHKSTSDPFEPGIISTIVRPVWTASDADCCNPLVIPCESSMEERNETARIEVVITPATIKSPTTNTLSIGNYFLSPFIEKISGYLGICDGLFTSRIRNVSQECSFWYLRVTRHYTWILLHIMMKRLEQIGTYSAIYRLIVIGGVHWSHQVICLVQDRKVKADPR